MDAGAIQGQEHVLCLHFQGPNSVFVCSCMFQPTPNRGHSAGTALLASPGWDNIHLPARGLQKTFTLLNSH